MTTLTHQAYYSILRANALVFLKSRALVTVTVCVYNTFPMRMSTVRLRVAIYYIFLYYTGHTIVSRTAANSCTRVAQHPKKYATVWIVGISSLLLYTTRCHLILR